MPLTERGDALAEVTTGIVRLFSDYYGRGPTRAKSWLLGDSLVVTVLEDTMTAVERTLASRGRGDLVRQVRITFQGAMAAEFKAVVERATGRRVLAYHSQLSLDPDMGFEFFVLA